MKSIALGLALFCVLLSSAAQIAMKRGMGAPTAADVGSTYLQALSSPISTVAPIRRTKLQVR